MSSLIDAINRLREVSLKHPLYGNIISTNGNIVIGKGNMENPYVLFIGEAPGNNENRSGIPFVGRSGKLLDSWINVLGTNNFAIINTVPMIPLDDHGKIRKPSKAEIEFFKPYVDQLIKEINPKYIICLGKSALEYMGISLKNSCWKNNIGFIYHPSYFLRRGQDGIDDFKKLLDNLSDNRLQKELGEF